MENFSISLAAARVNAKLTQPEVCEKLKISVNTLVNWEKGINEPKISQARELSRLYNIPLDRLIFMSSDSN